MEYSIRPARREDVPAILGLIRELAHFEKEANAVEVTAAQLETDGFGPEPRFRCFVGESAAGIAGMALVYPRYSTWKGRVVHLEDLIVTEAARGKGLGGALMTEVIRHAADQGARRVSWEVLDWNEPAIAFYEACGAKVLRDWDVAQLDAEGIAEYLERHGRE